MWEHGYTRAEATREAEARWTAHVTEMYAMMLMRKAKSWFTGYNSNVPGHEHGKIRYFVYNGGAPKYVARINDVAQKGYEGNRLHVRFDAFDQGAGRKRRSRRGLE